MCNFCMLWLALPSALTEDACSIFLSFMLSISLVSENPTMLSSTLLWFVGSGTACHAFPSLPSHFLPLTCLQHYLTHARRHRYALLVTVDRGCFSIIVCWLNSVSYTSGRQQVCSFVDWSGQHWPSRLVLITNYRRRLMHSFHCCQHMQSCAEYRFLALNYSNIKMIRYGINIAIFDTMRYTMPTLLSTITVWQKQDNGRHDWTVTEHHHRRIRHASQGIQPSATYTSNPKPSQTIGLYQYCPGPVRVHRRHIIWATLSLTLQPYHTDPNPKVQI